jgi:FAD synthase
VSTEIIDVLLEEGEAISSSRIRNAIVQGRLKEAQAMLGRPFALDISDATLLPLAEQSEMVNNGWVFNIAPGRVMPPSGSYEVLLRIKNDSKIKTKIQIEKGLIRIPLTSPGVLVSSECAAIEF